MDMSRIGEWMEPLQTYSPFVAAGLFGLLVIVFAVLVWSGRVRKRQREQLEHVERLLVHLKPAQGLENNLNSMLEIFSTILDAHGYAFYVPDEKGQNYLLKAVRHRHEDEGQVAPSYSGLAPFKKETYQPPISLPVSSVTLSLEQVKEGEVPLVSIPIGRGNGLVRIGPLHALSKRKREMLAYVASLLPQILETLVESDRMRMTTDVVVTSEHALHEVVSMALDSEAILRKTLSMFISAMSIHDAFILIDQGRAAQVPVLVGWKRDEERAIESDRDLGAQLWRALGLQETVLVPRGSEQYPKINSLLLGGGHDLLLISKFNEGSRSGMLVCRVDSLDSAGLTEEQLKTAIQTLSNQLSRLIRIQNGIKPLTQSYVELLKLLSRTIDNLNPYTVGYSELMSRYSVIIAQEMGLPQQEIRDIALAAYLSNIGVLGLSEELYLKEGKFSEIEFEKMKLHAEVGAVIIEMLLGNKAVASYIRHHHERMDGNGYPAGLRGQEIPTGAKIIAVVQTFLAKINGRKYRAPLPFEKALELLESSAGAQLDAEVVAALIRWFRRKQSTMRMTDRPLGPCWEVCCSTAEICSSCPAYQRPDVKCWEMPYNNCIAHGKSCKTCIVYTEAMSRRTQNVG